jgi:hypothetical protein
MSRQVDRDSTTAYRVDVSLKLSLVLLLCLPVLMPNLEQYAGKGMSWRILVFPVAALTIPVLWRLTGSRDPYPYLADNLIVLPPLLDVLWNTLDTYDRIEWWDDVNHLTNSAIFAAVIGLWAARYSLGAVNRFALAVGVGMTLQVLWEIGEYLTFLARTDSIADLYADTISDLAFDLAGSVTGAAVALLATSATAAGSERSLSSAVPGQSVTPVLEHD